MTDLPKSVVDYLLRISAQDRSPAFLEISAEDGLLLDWGGPVDAYGLDTLARDIPVTEQVVTLEGLLPADEAGVLLPCVSLEYGPPADIHVVRRDGRDWVLLLDASSFELRTRLPQQMANELLLQAGPNGPGAQRRQAEDHALMGAVLGGLSLVVLERNADRTFRQVSASTSWWERLCPDGGPGVSGLRPDATLEFLANFLVDAEEIWHRQAEGASLKSGWWQEPAVLDGGPWLEATALWAAGRAVLVIAAPAHTHAEQATILQAGRSKSLEVSALTRAQAGLRSANEELEADIRQRAFALAEANRRLERELEERRAAEAQVRLLAHSLESIAEMILLTDVEGRITFVNRAFLASCEYAEADVLGRDIALLWSQSGDGTTGRAILDMSTSGRWAGEMVCLRSDGSDFIAALRTSPVAGDEGRPAGIVWTVRDLSDEKYQQEAMRQVEERLRQAQKMEAVGRLAGGVAHDFNNLLTVMTGYTEMALSELDAASTVAREIEEVRRACDRGAALTRQLLAFSRKQILAPMVVDMNHVVTNLSSLLRRLIGEDIHLDVLPCVSPAAVRADVAQTEQVIMNLVVNARDAMPRGGRLSIEVTRSVLDDGHDLDPGPYVQLAVRDTGDGIDAETMSRIFEPFFTTKAEGRGTGLGLATVYGIVKQSGGEIFVESEPGAGTCFTIWLPEAHEDVPAPDVVEPSSVSRGSELVLLVEDEDAVRGFVRTLLQLNGYRVLEARNGEEAIRISLQHAGGIELLLTDTVMPGMSGTELRNALVPVQPAMKVLYMSGYPDDVTLRYQVEDRRAPFLQKPFSPPDLIAKVREVLEGRAVPRNTMPGTR
ncbi:MAG: ATP-binding protein [Vicinamibacterales bacterium]